MNVTTLQSERLILRPLRADDADALFEVFSDVELMRYWSSAPHESIEQTRKYVSENAMGDRWPTWAITLNGGTAIGWVVLPEHKESVREIGYILSRDYWGKGYAHEAVARVIDFAFEELNLRRIFADVDPDNEPSIGLLERLGFVREGRLRAEWETHIGVRDSYIYGLLRDEWLR